MCAVFRERVEAGPASGAALAIGAPLAASADQSRPTVRRQDDHLPV